MRAISLWQPWASAIALGAKRIETRPWATNYRGPLAIHAAKRCVNWEMEDFDRSPLWRGALNLVCHRTLAVRDVLPFGAIVATCNLIGCFPVEDLPAAVLDEVHVRDGDIEERHWWTERDMGNYCRRRFGWVLDDIEPLPEPVPWKGQQGFFNVPDTIVAR